MQKRFKVTEISNERRVESVELVSTDATGAPGDPKTLVFQNTVTTLDELIKVLDYRVVLVNNIGMYVSEKLAGTEDECGCGLSADVNLLEEVVSSNIKEISWCWDCWLNHILTNSPNGEAEILVWVEE